VDTSNSFYLAQRTGSDHPFNVRYKYRHAALQVSTRRKALLARRAARPALTAGLFLVGKYALGLYLGSGAPGSAYGAAGSLITMLIWIYYAAQIVLFGAEFTRVYAQARGRGIRPAKYALRVDWKEIELPPLTDRGDK
jgi:hypothetical protein